MILSFHPCFVGDRNILCAGRQPGAADQAAMQSADAVILPQGCSQALYEMAVQNCARVFPNYHARFSYPGKIGQIRLFEQIGVAHPKTRRFFSLASFAADELRSLGDYPLVFKFDWGGQGETVSLIPSEKHLSEWLRRAADYESTGQYGFLIQEYIPCGSRSLRVVVIGKKIISYWRIQKDSSRFHSNLSCGAEIDYDSDPTLQATAADAVMEFCRRTGINLAGFDILFSLSDPNPAPLFLEINYFFGRSGLNGSNHFYKLLNEEIRRWLMESS